ncbi:hypothetical protein [Colwellia psychrerythraea]|uniref:Uncharacterized protein n=1 Tax=Colwellia psychrerythraea TaxID=28229 RepID=A0A099KVL7_COLPS|nr:hypothetical protein [Colwellia psychrerythraea]KGJ93693.1 hypothetical protein ND2E_2186 [Colwellia psychrerythraea]
MKKYLTLLLILLCYSATSANLSEREQQRSRIVKGIYQLTDGALALCPKQDAAAFSKTLSLFKNNFPAVMDLVKRSPYRPVTKQNNVEATAVLAQQCLFKQRMLNNMMVTEEGKKTMAKALQTLTGAMK